MTSAMRSRKCSEIICPDYVVMSLPLFTSDDHRFMQHALRLAAKGLYTTTPNPRVGCVLVNAGKVVGEGYHIRTGGPHAEVHAIAHAGGNARGATAYVTLEPCSHYGRTPPCAQGLIDAGVAEVVVAMQDPNPQVSGRGIAMLNQAGIRTRVGLLEAEARSLNRGFLSRMERQRPWVVMKIGASLDGKTALANGESQWITSPQSRADVQRLRAESCAILTGVGTVLADNPSLTVRQLDIDRQPLRVIVDSQWRAPRHSQVFQDGNPTLWVGTSPRPEAGFSDLPESVTCCELSPNKNGRVDWLPLLSALASRGINQLMIEAGATINGSLLAEGWVDELVLYQAPVILGGAGRNMADFELVSLAAAKQVVASESRRVGPDTRYRLQFTPH